MFLSVMLGQEFWFLITFLYYSYGYVFKFFSAYLRSNHKSSFDSWTKKRNIWYIDSFLRFVAAMKCLSPIFYVSLFVCMYFFVNFQLARQKIIRNHELVGRARLIVWFHYKITLKTVFDPWLTCAISMFIFLI